MRAGAFLIACFVAALAGFSQAAAQGVTTVPFPLPGHTFSATLTGEQNGVLVHGVADTVIIDEWSYRQDISFPYVFACDGSGIGELHCVPDTATNNSYSGGWSRVEMRTAALRDGAGRIMVAWSAQRFSYNVTTSVQEAVLSLGVFENNVFRLLGRWPGASHPLLLRGADGTVLLIFVRQKLFSPPGLPSCDYSGVIQAASYRGDALLTPPVTVATGVTPSAVLDAANRAHIVSMEYDSIPAPVVRVQYVAGSGTAWGQPRTLATLPTYASCPYRPSVQQFPSVLAFAADARGIARVVLQRPDGWGSLLAFSSDGGSIAIDSVEGGWIGAASCVIDSTGAISCAHMGPMSGRDILYMRHFDPAMTAQRLERLANDSPYDETHPPFDDGIVLLRTKHDGLCLLHARASALWLFGKLEAGPRSPQLLAVDRVGYLLQDRPAACDSTGAMWFAYRQSYADDQPVGTLLLRIPPGTVPVARVDAPDAFALHCFPNPATTDASVRFNLPTEQTVTISVHNILGREVLRAADGREYSSGTHVLPLRVAELARGVYSVRMHAARTEAWTTLILR